jgi:predicted amidophosphoribosyltransferase
MQRNGQNPIRKARTDEQSGGNFNTPVSMHGTSNNVAGICSKCQTPVPPKPGFRPSALKCPKCGTPLGKK